MNTSAVIVAVVPALLIVGVMLAPILARRGRTARSRDRHGPDYDETAQSMEVDEASRTTLFEPGQHVDTPGPGPVSVREHDAVFEDWTALQAKFEDRSGDSTMESDHLTMEEMQQRA